MSPAARQTLIFWVHLAFIALMPVLILLSHRNSVGVVVFAGLASLFAPGLWVAARSAITDWRDLYRASTPATICAIAIAFTGWAALSALWTNVPGEIDWALQLFLFFGFSAAMFWSACQFTDNQLAAGRRWLLAVVWIAGCLLAIEGLSGGILRDIIPPEGPADKDFIAAARGGTITICLFFFALLALRGTPTPAGPDPDSPFTPSGSYSTTWKTLLLLVIVATAAIMLEITSNIAALGAGMIALFIGTLMPRLSLRLAFGGLIATFLLAPFLAALLPPVADIGNLDGGPTSWVQRVAIWRFAAEQIFDTPLSFLFGHGIQHGAWLAENPVRVEIEGAPFLLSVMPTHPHNLFLQIWMEFGIVGVAFWVLALVHLWRWIARLEPAPATIGVICGFGAAIFVYACVELSLYTVWRLVGPVLAIYGIILIWRLNRISQSPQS